MSEMIHLQPNFPPITLRGATCIPDVHGHCVTCNDDADQVTVLEVRDESTALVSLNGVTSEIDISLIDDVQAGQILLVHGGVALERVEAES